MFITTPLPFVKAFVDELNNILEKDRLGQGLSRRPRGWLACCLTGILVTHSVCWARFERARLGTYALAAFSWIFRKAKIPWAYLLQTSVTGVLRQYAITQGSLVADDSDKKRCQVTKRVFKAHKLKDKTSGGYINGHTLVLLLLVTPKVTMPVSVAYYLPDLTLTAWKKADEQLKKQGVPPQNRPAKLARNPAYPTKHEIALHLLEECRHEPRTIEVKMVLAEAL